MLPKSELLKGVEHRETVTRVIDLAEQALKTWDVVCSNFLSPPEVAECLSRLQPLAEIKVVSWGGYPQAERQRLAMGQAQLDIDASKVELQVISIRGNFLFDPATHRDFLGSLLGTGIVRDKVGDVLVLGEQGAQAIITPDLLEFLQINLTQVRTVPVKVQPIPLDQLRVPPPRTKAITTVEASLRLDAVGSAGFSMSRSKMVSEIENGDVRVNWKVVTQPSYSLSPSDLVTIRGRGRLQIDDVAETKKGRFRIQMTRYM